MYKLIAVDLDGTMLNKYGTVTEETKKTIKQTIEQGTDVIIASGRPIDSIKEIAKEIESNNYFIAGNGALIYDIKKDKIIYEKFLSKSKVLEIWKPCLRWTEILSSGGGKRAGGKYGGSRRFLYCGIHLWREPWGEHPAVHGTGQGPRDPDRAAV